MLLYFDYIIIRYGCEIIKKFCIISFLWDIKFKIIIGIFLGCFITLNVYVLVIIYKNNKKVYNKVTDSTKFDTNATNRIIIEKLDSYFETKNIDGALLLNGSWGSGKTYYIEKYVDSFNVNNKERAVYISLNGLKSIDEVNNALFASLHPVLSTTKKSLIIKVIGCVVYDGGYQGLSLESMDSAIILWTQKNNGLYTLQDNVNSAFSRIKEPTVFEITGSENTVMGSTYTYTFDNNNYLAFTTNDKVTWCNGDDKIQYSYLCVSYSWASKYYESVPSSYSSFVLVYDSYVKRHYLFGNSGDSIIIGGNIRYTK